MRCIELHTPWQSLNTFDIRKSKNESILHWGTVNFCCTYSTH